MSEDSGAANGGSAVAASIPWSRLWVFSTFSGLLWASLGFVRGVTLGEFVVLFAGGSSSLALIQMAVDAARGESLHAGRALFTAGVGAVLAGGFAVWLLENTHHRPLAAVTFLVLSLGLCLFAAALFSPLQISPKLGVVIATLSGLGLGYPLLAGELANFVLLELAVGLLLALGLARVLTRPFAIADSRAFGAVSGLSILGAIAFAFLGSAGAAAVEKAPIVAGIVGLLV